MKHIILFLAIVCSVTKAEAKKFEFPIEVVAGSADLIVIGEIDSIIGDAYIFNIAETLKGQSSPSIYVKMFREWTCDVRFDKPMKGQKLFLFLKNEASNWVLINGSNGELPILNNSITLKHEAYEQTENTFIPYTISVKDFKNGIRIFCKCYKFIGAYASAERGHFVQIGNDGQITKLKMMNSFSAFLNKKMGTRHAIKT